MVWLYRQFLRLLHPTVQRQVAGEMLDAFRQGLSRRPQPARTLYAARELVDLIANLRSMRRDHLEFTNAVPWRGQMSDGLKLDLGLALRSMQKNPAFVTIVALVLALGIGSSTAVFTVVDSVLLEPLPYDDAHELTYSIESFRTDQTKSVSYLNYIDWRERNTAFEEMGAQMPWGFTLTGEGDALELSGSLASASLFRTLGVEASLGRLVSDGEEATRERLVLLSDELWKRVFGADPSVLGRVVSLSGEPWTVIGVLPAGLEFPLAGTDIFAPLTALSEGDRTRRGSHPGISVIGRRKDGVNFDQAKADLEAVAAELAVEYADTNGEAGVVVESLHERLLGDSRQVLGLLTGAVLLLLLIACANVANLMLTRGQSRLREAAVRTTLGAGRVRVARPLVIEALLLGLLGGIGGTAIAWLAVSAFRASPLIGIPRASQVSLDGSVLLFVAGISTVTAVLIGALPAIRLSTARPAAALRDGAKSGTRSATRLRGGLVVAEVALSFVLLAGAGLMVRSVSNLLTVDPGLDPDGVLSVQVPVPMATYPTAQDRAAFYGQLIDAVAELPGVESVGAGDPLPLGPANRQSYLNVPAAGEGGLRTDRAQVTPGYFRTLGIPLIEGTGFTGGESLDAPTAVIDETLAELLWPGESAVGRQVRFRGDDQPWITVVGVARHVRHYGVNSTSRVQIYLPYTVDVWGLSLVVRATGDPATLTPAIRALVTELDPNVPLGRVRTMRADFDATIASETLTTQTLAGFGLAALALGILGLYGVMSYSVSQRTREIGVRIALGARTATLLRSVVGQGVTLAFLGVLLGLAGALVSARLLESLLYGVGPNDPFTLIGVGSLMLLVAAGSALLPGLRATHVDPAQTLRD